MRLDRLLDDVEVLDLRGSPATEVLDVTYDSTATGPGSLFCCLRGGRVDGHDFAGRAVEAGASALLCERPLALDVAQVVVADARAAMAPAAAALWGDPSRELAVVGITGTNGKTTTALLVQACLRAAGRATEVIGTMTGARTTPEAPDLQRLLAAARDRGEAAVALEVSSVGLAQHRVDAVWFTAGVFTNLSPDELAFHGSVEAYFEAKASLFDPARCAVGVVNEGDEWGRRIIDRGGLALRPFSLADAEGLTLGPGRSSFVWRGQRIELALEGAYNVENALAAATAVAELGVDEATIAAGLGGFEAVDGHGEDVDAGQPFRVVVDFAHTAGALAAVLDSVRASAEPGARVLVVFGCGGDRDPNRRPLMGAAAAAHADVVVVTSDNPRTEDPVRIVEQVADGARRARELLVEPDRRAAIGLALDAARPGDVVVIAGKGHETGQVIGDQTIPFDDREVARALLGNRVA